MKADFGSHVILSKYVTVLILVGLNYRVEFHIGKVDCHAAQEKDYTGDRQGLDIAHKHSSKTVQVSLMLSIVAAVYYLTSTIME